MILYLSLTLVGLVIIFMIFILMDYFNIKKQLHEKDVIYVDRSGIRKNPPENFIEVWQAKTINFKLDKYTVVIAHLPALLCIRYIEKLALCFKALQNMVGYEPTGKIDKFKHEIQYLTIYNHIIYLIYRLSMQFVNNKRGYYKALKKKAKNDIIWICGICEEIINYWTYVKKKIMYLSQGQTLQMAGGISSWDSLSLDGDGKILIKPRFEALSNIQRN